MKNLCPKQFGALILFLAALLAGCRSTPHDLPALAANPIAAGDVDLEVAQARAFQSKRPMIVLVADLGQNHADDAARALFETQVVKAGMFAVEPVVIDMGISRNRATAARFHVIETPLLVCLSPAGVIVSRDEKNFTKDLLAKRLEQTTKQSPELDAKLAQLTEAVEKHADDTALRFELTDFLIEHHNAFEAIPTLAQVAHSDKSTSDDRIRAWVELARAHMWIGEVEKSRLEAESLMATVGRAEARAGGALVLGLLDAAANHPHRAAREFDASISAAPQSIYGKQAVQELDALQKRKD